MDGRVEKFSNIIESCILGGAVGDTLGAEIEFWDLSRILSVYPQGVVPVCCLLNGESAITDDTQMTLFTAEGLTRALLAGHAGMSREWRSTRKVCSRIAGCISAALPAPPA